MPGFPLDRVRYIEGEKRSILDFPRLYVDGSSWIWYIGIVKKGNVKEMLKERAEEMREELERIREQIKELDDK